MGVERGKCLPSYLFGGWRLLLLVHVQRRRDVHILTIVRLQRQFHMLDNTRRQLAARTVLKDTLSDVDDTDNDPQET